MIVYYNVCDQCGNQHQIDSEQSSPEFESDLKNGFVFSFNIQSLFATLNDRKFTQPKLQSATFCDKECLIEYLKTNLRRIKEDR